MHRDLKDPIKVPFDRIYLDPNNPRIAPAERPGYEDPDVLFDDDLQEELEGTLASIYDNYEELKEAIITQGWVPIDAMIVWEHPKKKGWYVVVEGNTRTLTLRKIRQELQQSQSRLKALKAMKKASAAENIAELEERIALLDEIVKDTDQLTVYPVNAPSAKELVQRLPRLMGVRHITHAQQWKPFPQSLYILSLYEELFLTKYGDKKLAMDNELVKQVAQRVSQNELKTRRNIQSAYAFRHFKAEYEDRVPKEGAPLSNEDHYFFELILTSRYAAEQFRFGRDDLRLSNKMEEVLFKWAFAKARMDGHENPNLFYKAENIRLWNTMKSYDNANKTTFAAQLDVEKPDESPPGGFRQLEVLYLQHKAAKSPIETVASLIQALKELKVDSLQSQASHLRPMLEEMIQRGETYRRMIDAVAETGGDGQPGKGKGAEAGARRKGS